MTTVDGLPPAEYLGQHGELKTDEVSGLRTRLAAIAFTDSTEVFFRQVEVFELLRAAIPEPLHDVSIQPGKVMLDYSGSALFELTDDINEKLTQLSAVVPSLLGALTAASDELSRHVDIRFTLEPEMRALESHVEAFLFKMSSVLDLYARVAHVFNRSSPQKFGRQLHKVRSGEAWDEGYGRLLLSMTALATLHDYRNAIGHEVALGLRPWRTADGGRFVLVKRHSDSHGLLLPDTVEHCWGEIRLYASEFDMMFSVKTPALKPVAADNKL